MGADNFTAIMLIFAVFMAIGLLFTFLIPETKGKSLEEISEIQMRSSQVFINQWKFLFILLYFYKWQEQLFQLIFHNCHHHLLCQRD